MPEGKKKTYACAEQYNSPTLWEGVLVRFSPEEVRAVHPVHKDCDGGVEGFWVELTNGQEFRLHPKHHDELWGLMLLGLVKG